MTNDILDDAREFIGDRHERLQTHSDGCWRWHPACMVARLAREVERLRAEASPQNSGHADHAG